MTPSSSRERMIEATIDLMRASGWTGAGINEVVRASRAPKGSVYHHFPGGKHALVREALERYAEQVLRTMDEALASRATPHDKVIALFDAVARRAESSAFERSCAVGALALDMTPDLGALRATLAAVLERWRDAIAAHFGGVDSARARSYAGLLLTTIEGAYVRSRAERSTESFREAAHWLAPLA